MTRVSLRGIRPALFLFAFSTLVGCLESTPLDDSGSGGSGGNSGEGGSAGSAGSSGNSGNGGSAGSSGNRGSAGNAGSSGNGGSSAPDEVVSPNGSADNVDEIHTANVDKVDVLFVVDNSGSMREEQEALRLQFPRLIATLTRGIRPDGSLFAPARDLHLGVVSTDMGLPGVPDREVLGCGDDSRPLGDNGILQSRPNPGGAPALLCNPVPLPFLAFHLSQDPAVNDTNAASIANDLACLSSLGTSGCGFEMQLESALRALWPSHNILPDGTPGAFADNRPFLDGTPFGQGSPIGANTGFLRTEGGNVLAVVVVTDEDDCSSHTMNHFVPERFLPEGDPLKSVGLNLRCFNEGVRVGGEDNRDNGEANLYSVARYAEGFRSLASNSDVVFALIAGVPTDLADRAQELDFSDPAQRNAYYDALLADPALTDTVDPSSIFNSNLTPSCLRVVPGSDVPQRAFPPRRLIKVAKAIGENSTVQSICTDDFSPAFDRIIDRIASRLGPVCLPRTLSPDSDGTVACNLVWELPLPRNAPANSPTQCEQRPELFDLTQSSTTKDGRPLCRVIQVPVVACSEPSPGCVNGAMSNEDTTTGPIHGWFYDDFSQDVLGCSAKQRIAFTHGPGLDATPPNGVNVWLACD